MKDKDIKINVILTSRNFRILIQLKNATQFAIIIKYYNLNIH